MSPETQRSGLLQSARLFLFVVPLLSGCPTAFERDTGPDAAPFDGGTDAPCLDRDGDGARDAACGGTDCADDDPLVGRTPRAATDRTRSCSAGTAC